MPGTYQVGSPDGPGTREALALSEDRDAALPATARERGPRLSPLPVRATRGHARRRRQDHQRVARATRPHRTVPAPATSSAAAARDERHAARVADNVRDWFGVATARGRGRDRRCEAPDARRRGNVRRCAPAPAGRRSRLEPVAGQPTKVSTSCSIRDLDPSRRPRPVRAIGHTPQPAIVEMIARDLDAKQSGGFGSLANHDQLTREQLLALCAMRQELAGTWAGCRPWSSGWCRPARPSTSRSIARRATRT